MKNKKRRILVICLSFLILLCTLIISVFVFDDKVTVSEDSLNSIQQQLLESIEQQKGEYNENTLILSNTNPSDAKKLAKELNAELRLNSDGSFAILLLPGDQNLKDIVLNEQYANYLDEMCLDFHLELFDVEEEEEENTYIPSPPDYKITDSSYQLQTYLDYLNLGSVWNKANGEGSTIAIIDTGIDTDHPEFKNRISPYSYNATEDKIVKDYILEDGNYDWSIIEDSDGHGTGVAGVLAASLNDGEIVGLAPSANILVIKIVPESGKISYADVIFGLYYAIERDASVVNMSFGFYNTITESVKRPFEVAMQLAKDSDTICVAAAGNDSTASLTYPAASEYAIGVGALAENSWELADYSNYGENVNVVAPGTTYTATLDGKYDILKGTSLASPIVAAAVLLYKSNHNYIENNQVIEMLFASCKDLGNLGCDSYYGYGAIDFKALILDEKGTVTFNMLCDDVENIEQSFVQNQTLQNIPIPERLYYFFDGWYYDIHCTEEYDFYKDKFSSDLTLYAKWISGYDEDDGLPYTYNELEDGTIEITSYTGNKSYITIPNYIDGKVVSSIGPSAFESNKKIRGVNLPKYLVAIKDKAFYRCFSLKDIVIPNSVISIGNYAFGSNIRLSNVSFDVDSKLQIIGGFAFEGCSLLRTFTIPKYVNVLSSNAFYKAESIQSFDVMKGNEYYASINGILYDRDIECLICYPSGRRGNVALPSSVKVIGPMAFENAKIEEITDWGSVEEINNNAFSHSSLKTLILPNTLVKLGEGVFSSNENLNKVIFNEGLTEIPNSAFSGCTSLKSIVLSNSIEKIGVNAFLSSNLTEVHIPKNVKEIGEKAFERCKNLTKLIIDDESNLEVIGDFSFRNTKIADLYIPNKVTIIGIRAFEGVPLNSVIFAENSILDTIDEFAFANTKITNIKLPDSLKTLKIGAFSNSKLTTITISKYLNYLGGGVFAGCDISYIDIDDNNPHFEDIDGVVYDKDLETLLIYPSARQDIEFYVPDGIKTIGAYSFERCKYLENVFIPDSVVEISKSAFAESSIVNFEAGKGLEVIGLDAFSNAINLKSVKLSNVKEIRDTAFCWCVNLSSINLPEGLVDVGISAFYRTDSLGYVTIPESLTTLGYNSFYGCGAKGYILPTTLTVIEEEAFAFNYNLTSIDIPDNVVHIGKYAFYKNSNMKYVNFTENSKLTRLSYGVFAYSGLSAFKIPANVSIVSSGVFTNCDKLKEVTIVAKSKLESITSYMFAGCVNLTNIIFEDGNSLSSIQSHGFEGLTNLKTLDLTNVNLTNVDNFAFRYCESLEEVYFSEGLENIGRFAFHECSNLSKITIPSTVNHIGRSAFLGTNNINLFFEDENLPEFLDENWDYGVKGYYLGVSEIKTDEEFEYAVLKNGSIALIKYLGFGTSIDLSKLNLGGEIVNIGGSCFANTLIEEVILPPTLVNIQSKAFFNAKIKEIVIPSTVEFIGNFAFSNSSLSKITFEKDSKLRMIEESAFENASKLDSIILPKSLISFGTAVFKNSGLKEVIFEDGIKLSEIPKEAFAYTNLTSVVIPDNITLISSGAFQQIITLKTVELNSNTNLEIMDYAFYKSGLEEVNILSNVTYIGEFAFNGLFNLQEFTVETNNKYYSTIDGVLVDKNHRKLISMPAGRIGEYIVPKSIEIIDSGAFEESKLSKIDFDSESNLLSFGYRAFYNACNITTITIPDSIVSINFYAFAKCSNLKEVIFAEGSRLSSIYEGAFYLCSNLTNIQLPDSVVEIFDFAFYGCNKLTYIPVSENSKLTGIYSYAMAYTGLNGDFVLHDSVIEVGEYAFLGTKITSITIPDTNMYDLFIGIGAFEDCNNVKNVTLPFIGSSFEDYKITWFGYIFGAGSYEANSNYVPTSIEKITITEGISEIGKGAFYELTNVKEIELPHSITMVYIDSFTSTTAKYTFTNYITGVGKNKFHPNEVLDSMIGAGYYGELYVSSINKVVSLYSVSRNIEKIIIEEGVSTVEISYIDGLKELNLPDSVTKLSVYGCSDLQDIHLGSYINDLSLENVNLTNISLSENNKYFILEDSILYNNPITEIVYVCRDIIDKIEIKNGVTAIKTKAFHNVLVSEVILPNSVVKIEKQAFYNNLILNKITLPESLITIENNAFDGCESLFVIYNNSSLTLNIGSYQYGNVALYAEVIILPNGNQVYKDSASGFDLVSTTDGFVFKKVNEEYTLLTYIGNSTTIRLPKDVNGNKYNIESFKSKAEVIIIPNGEISIGSNAFSNCDNLVEVIVDENNDNYMSYDGVLYHKSKFGDSIIFVPKMISGEITILGNVRSINNFRGIKNVEKITISEGVEIIPYYAFEGCESLKTIIIPESVTTIEYGAFRNCVNLKNINLPNNLINFGSSSLSIGVFENCKSLESIIIPKSITAIPNKTFKGCNSLINVEIHNNIVSIGEEAFEGSLLNKTIILPKNIKVLKENSFDESTKIIFPNTTHEIDDIIYNHDFTSILYIPKDLEGDITIAEGVVKIEDSAFKNRKITSIVIPNTVTTIEDSAFANTLLEKVIIPDSVTTMRDYVFSDCKYLNEIQLSSNLSSLGSNVFNNCVLLEEVTIPGSVKNINMNLFKNCTNLKKVVLEEGVNKISFSTFVDCTNLQEIVIPNTLRSFSSNSFVNSPLIDIVIKEDHPNLNEVDDVIYDENYTQIVYVSNAISGDVVVPEGIENIGSSFSNCANLKSLTLPNTITNFVSSKSFDGCSNMTAIYVGSDHPTYVSIDGVLYDKEITEMVAIPGGYKGCLNIAEGVTSLNENFNWLVNIDEIVLPSTLVYIQNYLFISLNIKIVHNNSSLPIKLGDRGYGSVAYNAIVLIDSNGNKTFENNYNKYEYYVSGDYKLQLINEQLYLIGYTGDEKEIELPNTIDGKSYLLKEFSGPSKVIIPQGWTEINANAFANSNIESITLPKSIKKINDKAFYYCNKLREINLHEGIEYIGERCFEGCLALTFVDFPSSLKSLNSSSFANTGLEKAFIPNTITHIGPNVFNNCNYLAEVTLEEGITEIPFGMFSGNKSLSIVNLPSSVEVIGAQSFKDCSNLSTIEIGENIKSVGEYAFYNTAFYNDNSNWEYGVLYLKYILIRVSEEVKYFELKDNIKLLADSPYANCQKLKIAYVFGNNVEILKTTTNVETVVIMDEMPDQFYQYFHKSVSYDSLSYTLKNIVISKDCKMKYNVFVTELFDSTHEVSGYKIFVEDTENETMWDENYNHWNGNNTVFYGDRWKYVNYYNNDGSLVSKDLVLNTSVVRLPWINDFIEGNYLYQFKGFDIDNDGVEDTIAATYSNDINLYTVFEKEHICSLGHTGGMATCQNLAICTKCGEVYGSLDLDNHLYSDEMNSDEIYHWHKVECDHGEDAIVKEKHEFIWTELSPATCTKAQVLFGVCECGYTTTTYGLDALGHNFDPPFEYDSESHWKKCSCGEFIKDSHNILDGEIIEDATCSLEGLKTIYCSECSYTETVVIPSLGHKGGTATCSNKATCVICGESYGELLEHNYSTEFSYDNKYHWKKCSCGEFIKDSHNILDGEIIKDATCSLEGLKTIYCSECSYTETVVIPSLGHKGGTATCSNKATCVICGESYGELLEHNYSTEFSYDNKYHWHECSCGDICGKELHDNGESNNNDCLVCGYKSNEQTPTSNTGCAGSITTSILSIISLLTFIYFVKKRKEEFTQ